MGYGRSPRGAPVEPRPDRPGEAGVVHRPVPAVAGEIERRVVAVLGEQPGVRPLGGHRATDGLRDVVGVVVGAQPAGHVGDVDAPPVEAVPQPPGDHRVRAVVEPPAHLGRPVVELGQRRDLRATTRSCRRRGSGRSPARERPGRSSPRRTRGGGRRCGWWSGRPRPACPRSCAASSSRRSAGRHRAPGRPRRRTPRRSGGWSGPRRTASGTAASRRGRAGGRAAPAPRRACRRTTGTGRRGRGARPGRPSRPAGPTPALHRLAARGRSGRGRPGSRPGPGPRRAAGARS